MAKILDDHLFEEKQEFPQRKIYLTFAYAALIFIGNIIMISVSTRIATSAHLYQILIAAFLILVFFAMLGAFVIGVRNLLGINSKDWRPSKVFPDNRKAQIQFFCYTSLSISFFAWLILTLVLILDQCVP